MAEFLNPLLPSFYAFPTLSLTEIEIFTPPFRNRGIFPTNLNHFNIRHFLSLFGASELDQV